MKCKNCQDLFYDHYNGTLSKKENSEVILHIEKCKNCQKEFELFEITELSLIKFKNKFKEIEPPRSSFLDIMEKVEKKSNFLEVFFNTIFSTNIKYSFAIWLIILVGIFSYSNNKKLLFEVPNICYRNDIQYIKYNGEDIFNKININLTIKNENKSYELLSKKVNFLRKGDEFSFKIPDISSKNSIAELNINNEHKNIPLVILDELSIVKNSTNLSSFKILINNKPVKEQNFKISSNGRSINIKTDILGNTIINKDIINKDFLIANSNISAQFSAIKNDNIKETKKNIKTTNNVNINPKVLASYSYKKNHLKAKEQKIYQQYNNYLEDISLNVNLYNRSFKINIMVIILSLIIFLSIVYSIFKFKKNQYLLKKIIYSQKEEK